MCLTFGKPLSHYWLFDFKIFWSTLGDAIGRSAVGMSVLVRSFCRVNGRNLEMNPQQTIKHWNQISWFCTEQRTKELHFPTGLKAILVMMVSALPMEGVWNPVILSKLHCIVPSFHWWAKWANATFLTHTETDTNAIHALSILMTAWMVCWTSLGCATPSCRPQEQLDEECVAERSLSAHLRWILNGDDDIPILTDCSVTVMRWCRQWMLKRFKVCRRSANTSASRYAHVKFEQTGVETKQSCRVRGWRSLCFARAGQRPVRSQVRTLAEFTELSGCRRWCFKNLPAALDFLVSRGDSLACWTSSSFSCKCKEKRVNWHSLSNTICSVFPTTSLPSENIWNKISKRLLESFCVEKHLKWSLLTF